MRKFIIFISIMLSVIIETSAKDWYLIGDFNEWTLETSVKMDEAGEDLYSLTIPSLEGEFKFIADKDWAAGDLGCADYKYAEISKNIITSVEPIGNNFFTKGILKNLNITLNTTNLTVEFSGLSNGTISSEGDPLYILGDVRSMDGLENNWLAPTQKNKEIYDDHFRLTLTDKINMKYQGIFYFPPMGDSGYFYDDIPKCRFYTALNGWNDSSVSLGADYPEFECIAVDMNIGKATCNLYEGGRSNWGMCIGENWTGNLVGITVNLSKKRVEFELIDSGVDEIETTEEDNNEIIWYNTCGQRVEFPTKGVFLRVWKNKVEKIIF